MDRFVVAAIVVDEKMDVIRFMGHPAPYLRRARTGGLNLLTQVRRHLIEPLRASFDLARRGRVSVLQRRAPSLEVVPMGSRPGENRRFMVLIGSAGAPRSRADTAAAGVLQAEAAGGRSRGIEPAVSEDLLLNMEKLQRANEELRLARDELEGANRELASVNVQLAARNQELTEVSNDLINRDLSTSIPILMLTGDLRVRRSTPAADAVMGLDSAHLGRRLHEIPQNLKAENLEALAAEVLRTSETREIEVQDRDRNWYALRLSPYRVEDGRIDGVVLALFDISRIKRSLEEMERARNFSRAIVETVRGPLLVVAPDGRVLMANQAFYETFHTSREETENRKLEALRSPEFGAAFKDILDEALQGGGTVEDREIWFDLPGPGPTVMATDVRPCALGEGGGTILMVSLQNITRFRKTVQRILAEHYTVKEAREQAELSLRESKEDLRRSREELRTLAGRLLNSQEEERRRVARELHDDLGQTLALLEIESAGLARLVPRSGETHRGLTALRQRVEKFADQVRRVAHDLHPSILAHLGLPAALRSHCDEVSSREGIAVAFSASGDCAGVSEDVALCLYRVTQEGLRNAVKHAEAGTVEVTLKCRPGGLHLSIVDGGRGFEPAAVQSGGGLGLLSMQERVRLVDGTFSVKSIPGKGTRIAVQIPRSSPRS